MKNTKIYMDLHNHTTYSDGYNTPRDMIEYAVSNNINIFGITDHFEIISALPVGLTNYIEEINKLKSQYSIKILTGLEISAFSILNDFDGGLIDILNKLDYILIEEMDYLNDSDSFEQLKQVIVRLLCKRGLAHTDIAEMSTFNEYNLSRLNFMMKFMQECNLFWELNISPGRKFSKMLHDNTNDMVKFIKMLNEKGIPISIGSDCHSLKNCTANNILYANEVLNDCITLRPF